MTSTFNDTVDGVTATLAFKAPCRAATRVNITLSGEQTIDGVAVVDGDRVLVKAQNNAVENGIYVCSTLAWTRAKDFDGARDVTRGTMVRITEGTVNDNTYWAITTNNPIVIGTSSLTFQQDNNVLGEGVLEDGVVTLTSLSAEVLALIQAGGEFVGAWETSIEYTAGDSVSHGGFIYMATEDHTSGTFSTDLNDGKWVKISATSLDVGANIASATALPVNVSGTFHSVTGTTPIESFAALDVGISKLKVLRFADVLTITHHSTNLVLPDGENIVTQAGDQFMFYEYESGKVRMIGGNGVYYSPGLTRDLNCRDKVLSRPEIKDYAETTPTPESSGGSLTIDFSAGNVQNITLTEDVQVVFSNPPAEGKTGNVTLILTQDENGGHAVNFTTENVLWSGGGVPELSTDADAVDVLTFMTVDAGDTILGFPCGIGMA